MEILSALGTTPIQRLKRTWQALPAKDYQTYKDLQDFMSNLQNFKSYRTEMRENASQQTPVLPYFGL
jgi:son of sevenless-like protein